MTVRVALLAAAMVPAGVCASSAGSPSSVADPYRSVVRQIEPGADLTDTYPGAAQVSAAIAVVPNPLVPRYRRLYDLTIQALELGMRALYVVTDTATYGVAPLSLRCAVDRIQSQLDEPQADGDLAVSGLCPRTTARQTAPRFPGSVTLLRYPGNCSAASDADKALVVLGPNFSGAFDSFGRFSGLPQGFGMRPGQIHELCLVSFAATATTNAKIEQASHALHFTPTALPDFKKIFHIRQLISHIGLDPDRPGAIAILAEASTFGYGVCDDAHPDLDEEDMREFLGAQKLCRQASSLYFPATISDIRYGVDAQRRAQHAIAVTSIPGVLDWSGGLLQLLQALGIHP